MTRLNLVLLVAVLLAFTVTNFLWGEHREK